MKDCTTITVPAVTVITTTRLPIRVQATRMENKHYSIVENDRHDKSCVYTCIHDTMYIILCLSSLMMLTLAVTVQSLCTFTTNYESLAKNIRFCLL